MSWMSWFEMNKCKYLSLLCGLFLGGCQQQHDAYYYASHPQALQEALRTCSEHTSQALSCDALRAIQARMGHLVYLLQANQLAYGREILALQEKEDEYRRQLKGSSDPAAKASLSQVQAQIQEYLLPVQWLESPRNRT